MLRAGLWNPDFLATALSSLSSELAGQIAAPDFDPEFNLHRASTNRLIRMRMEAWVEVQKNWLQKKLRIPLTGRGRLMEDEVCPPSITHTLRYSL